MSAVRTQFRRLVTSLMLAAMASFVLHGGAIAGMHQHGMGSTDCATTALAGHVHPAAADDHSSTNGHPSQHDHGGVAHQHADASLNAADAGDQATKSKASPCCASVCAFALTGLGSNALSAPMGIAVALLPASENGAGMSLDGLTRPPRTPGIA